MNNFCTTCQAPFEISDADRAFYEKAAPVLNGKTYAIPAPTLCPGCRMRRRMAFRNERTLYERTCDVTEKKIISIFAPETAVKVCDKSVWYSDKFNPLEYGKDYNFNRPFFEQFQELLREVPLPSLRVEASENCDFNNDMRSCNDCYLCTRTHESQNMLYCYRGNKSCDCMDCTQVTRCELCYECVECLQCHSSKYLDQCNDCTDCAFCIDCKNCMSCFLCSNLRNKEYCYKNEQLTKEEYQQKIAEHNLASTPSLNSLLQEFAVVKQDAVYQDRLMLKCEDSTGADLVECSNCHDCFGVQQSQDCRYVWDTKLYSDSYDCYSGGRDSELVYDSTSVSASHNSAFCVRASGCNNLLYCLFSQQSHDCFGCIGMQRQEYCILNKPYSKDEYEQLLGKILEHMTATGEYGEFFPASCCPFAYNETVANEYFPLEEPQAVQLGYSWKDLNKELPNVTKVIPADRLPDAIDDIPDDVLNWAIVCEETGRPFIVQSGELKFYRNMRLAPPHVHPDVRHLRRHHRAHARHLHESTCTNCNKKIDTNMHDTLKVHCQECYLQKVY